MSKRLLPGIEYPQVNEDGGLQITADAVVQDYIKYFGDRTLLTGGTVSDNGDGTAAVASGTAWAKVTDSDAAIGKFFSFSADNNVSLTDQVTNYIYLDYNDGVPQIVVSTSITTHGLKQDHIHVATIFRNGTTLHSHQEDNIGIGRGNRIDFHLLEEHAAHRVAGLVTSDGGSLALSITAGVLYEGNNRHTTSVDGSTWSTWYYNFDTSSWVETTGQTTINNTQYNLTGSGTGLATLTANRYAVHWVYVDIDGADLHIVYGQGDYKINEAEEATVPSLLPNQVTNYGILIAKIIVQKSQTSLTILYPWTTIFTSSFATDHGSLGGLAHDDHTQYMLNTVADANAMLYSVTDNTPAALAMAASRIPARLAAGNVIAATGAEIIGLLTGANLDVGAYDVRGQTLTADGLTSGRVVYTGASGVLSAAAGFTYASTTLTVPKIGAFEAAGAINFASQNMTNVDIDSGTIGGITLDGTIAGGVQTINNLGLLMFGVTAVDSVQGPTVGIIINQGANDDSILVGQSSDVAHGMTTLVDTDTYMTIGKATPLGGFAAFGYRQADGAGGYAFYCLARLGENADTTKSNGSIAPFMFIGQVKSGTTVTSVNAGGNIFVIANHISTKFILDAEGDLWLAGGLTVADNIVMGSNKITGLAAGSSSGDSVRFEQLTDSPTKEFSVSVGTGYTTGALSFHGDFAALNMSAGHYWHLNLKVPHDFSSLTSCKVVYIEGGTGTFDWTVTTDWAAIGTAYTNESDTATANGVSITDLQIGEVDISAAFTNIAADDYVGIKFLVDAITASMRIIGLVFRYS